MNEQINMILKKSTLPVIQQLVAIQEAPAAASKEAADSQGPSNMMRKFNQGQQQRGSANGRGSVNNTLKGNTLSN